MEDRAGRMWNIVGFQTRLKWGDQLRVLRMVPGLGEAEFLRMGQIHRNTYINSPTLLSETLQLRSQSLSGQQIFFAGQICGVEGYVESIATGLLAGTFAAALATHHSSGSHSERLGSPGLLALDANEVSTVRNLLFSPPPRSTAHGSLLHYITHADAKNFQPANITFDLLPALPEKIRDRKLRHQMICQRALRDFDSWLETSLLSFRIAGEESALHVTQR